MCFSINDSRARGAALFSDGSDGCVFSADFGTARLIAQLTDYRSFGSTSFGRLRAQWNQDCLSVVGRRTAAGFGYLGLAVVSAVEAVARIMFALLALLPAALYACIDCGDSLSSVVDVGFTGLLGGPDAILRCLIAFVKNFYRDRLSFTDLRICS